MTIYIYHTQHIENQYKGLTLDAQYYNTRGRLHATPMEFHRPTAVFICSVCITIKTICSCAHSAPST